jgi:hypothetical protein
MVLDLMDLYQYMHHKKITQEFHIQLYFEVYMQFLKIMTSTILSQIYFICSSFSMFVEFFKFLIRLSLKLIKYT